MEKKKGRKRRNQAEHVCMHDGGSGGGKEKQKERKKWRIVVKLRRKQRSRWNNAMFHARRLTFPRNNEVNKKNSYILNGNALYNPG